MDEAAIRDTASAAYDAKRRLEALSSQNALSGTLEEQRESFVQYHLAVAAENEAFAKLASLTKKGI